MVETLEQAGISRVDGVAMDVGVSSMQLDQPARGFAFAADGPLDMRMEKEGLSAADFLNTAPEGEIADVLFQYGEERQSRRVARAIVAARPLSTTGEFAHVVRKALGHNPNFRGPGAPKDPATRSFQAVRIHVNAELDELEAGLFAAESLLRSGGKLAVVSFHSLEDRIVKQFLRAASGAVAAASRHLPQVAPTYAPTFARVAKARRPSDAEVDRNPRARSATLRSAVRTEAPARTSHEGGRAA
jgi:16S rRNA (cytosine1402-N4)-methyltransferase